MERMQRKYFWFCPFSERQYDITLPLGFLYHLYSTEEKRQTLCEAIRVTKQGGVIFAAYVISEAVPC